MAPEPELFKTDPRASSAHPPIHEALGPHPFVESEFEHGKGRCDRCGGGPLAEIHQQKPDPFERIANELEEIDTAASLWNAYALPELRKIEAHLGRMASDASARSLGPLWMWFLVVGAAAGWGLWLGYHLR